VTSAGVADLDRSARFYDAVFALLGIVCLKRGHRGAEYGLVGESPFAIVHEGVHARAPGSGSHMAFAAKTRDAVDAFHAAAIANGGIDDGPPGIRLSYNPGYYAAFVRDPDGYRLEAVLHEPM
jgi:catechol 2,3-dioxygenase-like lactoylglutathione lyase family enzyme